MSTKLVFLTYVKRETDIHKKNWLRGQKLTELGTTQPEYRRGGYTGGVSGWQESACQLCTHSLSLACVGGGGWGVGGPLPLG